MRHANRLYSKGHAACTTFAPTPFATTTTITADDKVYDGNNTATFTCDLSGVLGSDDVSCTGGTATFADKNVGTNKPVTATGLGLSGADAGNYQLASTTDTDNADITPRPITVTADVQTKVYGASDPALTYTVGGSGLASGDTLATVFSGALARAVGETVAGSPYAITQGTLALSSNYTLTYIGANFTITPLPITTPTPTQLIPVTGDEGSSGPNSNTLLIYGGLGIIGLGFASWLLFFLKKWMKHQ